jgi:hypothetical protein
MNFHAVARLAAACGWMQDVLGLETTRIARPALARQCFFQTQLFGANLRYAIHLDGGFAYLHVEGYNQTAAPEKPLLRVPDGTEGLKILCRLIRDLERSGTTAIHLPLQLGEPGMADSWVIA